ncbi:MAG TPA: lysylphosphatidylglycerol synthase domain-containing protein [Candidatus Tectomicrobia bacterium]
MLRHRLMHIVPWIVTIVIFVVIFQRLSLEQVHMALRRVHLAWYLALMVPYSLLYCSLDAFVLAQVLSWFHGRVPYRRVLPVRAAAYILALLNPSLGQGAVAFAMHRRESVPLLEVAGTLLFLTLLEVCQLALYAALGIFGFHPHLRLAFAPVYAVLGAALGGALFCIRRDIDPVALVLTGMGRWRTGNPTYCAPSYLPRTSLLHAFRQARWQHYLLALLYKAPNFLLAVVVHYFALQLFGIQVPFVRLLGFLPIVFLVASLPITVAHLGTSQAAWIYFFSAYGEEAQLLAYSLVAHVTFMVLNGLIGVCFLRLALQERPQ